MKTFLILFTLLSSVSYAQQETVINQFWNNYAHFNPAATGLLYKHTAGLNYRNQWTGLSNSPQTLNAFYNANIGGNHGAGIDLGTLKTGLSQTSYATLQYNYQMVFGDRDNRLGIAIAPSYHSFAQEDGWLPPDTIDDPSLPQAGRSDHLVVNAGITLKTRKLLLGASIRRFNVVDNNPNFDYAPHYYGLLTYQVNLTRRIKLFVDGIVGTDAAFTTAQANARFIIWNKLTAMLGYQTDLGPIIGAGWDLKEKFRGMYTFQLTSSKLNGSINAPSHEVSLVYLLDFDW